MSKQNLQSTLHLKDHVFEVFSDRFLPVDEHHLSTGEIVQLNGQKFDLRNPTDFGAMKGDAERTMDGCYVLSLENDHTMRHAAR